MSHATVERLDTVIIDLPLRRPHKFKSMSATHQSYLLARVRTTDGVEGVGEAVVPGGPWWGGESVETMKVVIDTYIAPVVTGADPARPELLMARADRVVAGNAFAKAAVEMALFDVWGKTVGLPVHQLLGGLYRDSIPVTWALGADSVESVIDEAEQKLSSGLHSSFKLKMGAQDPAADVERIIAVAKVLGDKASVRVDLNAAWDEITAARWLPSLEAAGVDLIEQPVPGWNVGAMSRLADQLRIPVMADESVQTLHDAMRVCTEGAADIFSLKVHKHGGLLAARKVGGIAAAAGLPCHGGTSIESSVGVAAAAHVYGAMAEVTFGSELFGPMLLAEDIVTNELTYTADGLRVPSGPGLGVTLDEAKVAEFTRD